MIIGLTGGIASGKSTAARHLETLGAFVIDADRLGHQVYEPGSPGHTAVVAAFGDDVVADDWSRPYGREVGAYPPGVDKVAKYWPPVSRIDGGYGDRNLVCSCPPVDAYASD
ncbi:MAG: dephospho-CoA kinase [Actinomycetota bacterium]